MFMFEINKILSRRFFIAFSIIFTVFVLITYRDISLEFSYKQMCNDTEISELYSKYYNDPEVVVKEYEFLTEQVELLRSEENNAIIQSVNDKYYLYSKLLQDANRKEQYLDDTSSVIRQAKYHLLAYDKEGVSKTSYLYRYQAEVASLFSYAQKTISFGFEHYAGWDSYFDDQNFSAFVYLVLIGYLILNFYIDKRSGNDDLICPTKHGKWKYIISKYFSHNVVMFICVIFCEFSRLYIVYLHHGLSSPLNNIQVFSCFTMNPHDITILHYFMLYIIVKYVTSMFMFSIGLLGCLLCHHISIFIITYIGTISVMALLHTLTNGSFGTNGLFEVHTFLQKYRTVNFFGTVVYAPLFYSIICIISTVAAFILLIYLYYKRYNTPKMSTFSFMSHRYLGNIYFSGAHICLIFHELYKQFIHSRKWIVILLAFIFIVFIQWNECEAENTYTESLYREHIKLVEGAYTEEKEDYIKQQYQSILNILSIEGEMREKYQSNLITFEEYRQYIHDFTSASTTQYIYLDLLKKTEFLKVYQNNSGKTGYYLYEKGYHLFNTSDSYLLYILFLVVFCGTSFLPEYVSKNNATPMLALIRASKTGLLGLKRTKYSILLMSNIMLYAIASIWRLGVIGSTFHFKFILADICCLNGFEQLPFSMSILLFYIMFFLYSALIIIALTAVLLVIGKMCKTELQTLMILLVIILPTLLEKLFDHAVFSTFALSSLIKISHFTKLLQGETIAVLSSVVVCCAGIISITYLYETYKININKRWNGE